MKAITTIFESILGKDDSLVWTPADGRHQGVRRRAGWDWGTPRPLPSALGLARLISPLTCLRAGRLVQ